MIGVGVNIEKCLSIRFSNDFTLIVAYDYSLQKYMQTGLGRKN